MVPADSRRIPRVPRYSGYHSASSGFAYAAFTPCGGAFQRLPLAFLVRSRGPTTLRTPKRPKFGLFPVRSPLLGESFLFSFPAGTKMFQFPAFASVFDGCHPFRMTGCPIRKSAHHRLFAPTRGFSQLITSFIASESLGIHHVPFFTSWTSAYYYAEGILGSCVLVYNMSKIFFNWQFTIDNSNVENNGFEPLTPCLQSRCSSQLS